MNEEKIVKWLFWIVTIFVICVLFFSVNEFNSEMDKYQALYKGITTFDVVEKENSEKALELANWDKYIYNDNEIYVTEYPDVGDLGYKNGIRFFDGEGLFPKDNNIVNLIPKDYFFTYIPEGKIVIGSGYGYYIRTVKDLKEENEGYNSDNYFKSVVLLFTYDETYTEDEGKVFGRLEFNKIGLYEFHSYDKVSKKYDNIMPSEYSNYIKTEGVVNFYKSLGSEAEFKWSIEKTEVSLDYEATSLGYEFTSGLNNKVQTNNGNFIEFVVVNNKNNSQDIKLRYSFILTIRDGLWTDITMLSDIYYENIVINKQTIFKRDIT